MPDLKKEPLFEPLFLGLKFSIPILKNRIEKRLELRIRKGLVKEVTELQRNGLSWARMESLGLEYRWVAFYLQGKINQEEMKEGIVKDSIKLVKNQMNWFKKDERIKWINDVNEAKIIIREFID